MQLLYKLKYRSVSAFITAEVKDTIKWKGNPHVNYGTVNANT